MCARTIARQTERNVGWHVYSERARILVAPRCVGGYEHEKEREAQMQRVW